MPSTQNLILLRQAVNNKVKNANFSMIPPFTAAQTTRGNWINGTATGSTTQSYWHWALGGPADGVSAQYDTTTTYSPGAALKLSNTNTTGQSRALMINSTNYSSVTQAQAIQYLIPVLGSTSYTLTAYIQTSNVASSGAYVQIAELSGTGALGTVTSSNKLTGTVTWTQVTATVTTASTTRFVGIVLNNDVAGNISSAWFDNVQFDLTAGTTRQTATTRQSSVYPNPTTTLFWNGDYDLQSLVPINSVVLQPGASSGFTCGAKVWLYPKSITNNSDDHCICNADLNFGSNLGYAFYVKSNTGAVDAVIGNTFYTSTYTGFTYNTWHWVIFVLNGTSLIVYVDGVNVYAPTVVRPATGNAGNQGFMREFVTSGSGRVVYGYSQDIFSVRLALTQTQVTNIVSNNVFPSGLDVHYLSNEGDGFATIDQSGNNNHGILTNQIWSYTGRRFV